MLFILILPAGIALDQAEDAIYERRIREEDQVRNKNFPGEWRFLIGELDSRDWKPGVIRRFVKENPDLPMLSGEAIDYLVQIQKNDMDKELVRAALIDPPFGLQPKVKK